MDDSKPAKEKVLVVIKSILEGKYCIASGLFCINSGDR